MTTWDPRRVIEGLEAEAYQYETDAKSSIHRALSLRQRIVRLHEALDQHGVPDPEGWAEKARERLARMDESRAQRERGA